MLLFCIRSLCTCPLQMSAAASGSAATQGGSLPLFPGTRAIDTGTQHKAKCKLLMGEIWGDLLHEGKLHSSFSHIDHYPNSVISTLHKHWIVAWKSPETMSQSASECKDPRVR